LLAIAKLQQKGREFEMSPELEQKVIYLQFIEDCVAKLFPKRQIVQELVEKFNLTYPLAYHYYNESHKAGIHDNLFDKKAVLMDMIIEMSLKDRDKLYEEEVFDGKSAAAIQRNLIALIKYLPEAGANKDTVLPVPVFLFSPELIKSSVTTNPKELNKILAELKAKKKQKKIGEYVKFEEVNE